MMADTLLPPNATALETAIEDVAKTALTIDVPIDQLWSPANVPEALLGYLAWALSVDKWDSSWPPERKREVITTSIEVHRRKGTPWAVKRVLDAQGFTARLLEWNRQQVPGAPFTFQLFIESNQTGYSHDEVSDLLKWVNEVKSVRSHLEAVYPIIMSNAPAQAAAIPSISPTITVGPIAVAMADVIDGGAAGTDYRLLPTINGGSAIDPGSDYEVNP